MAVVQAKAGTGTKSRLLCVVPEPKPGIVRETLRSARNISKPSAERVTLPECRPAGLR